ncbi:hypothetical protein FA95DRAFT_1549397 [Auriscalpium vulgare]|uniref:Uncharacterized protein n=1 Tax=Auriscalpium vulgare TaxID=40419 RepID=A0ACB8R9Y8_9AGAM|nr:hypothetical protein FA95DRAFT_1549397 [Auriscalpium vulgare]
MAEPDVPFIPPDEDVSFEEHEDHEEAVVTGHLLENPPRKRPRLVEEDEDMKPPASPPPTTIVRDSEFYLSDGSCILLVQNVLFNVHRTTLSKDSSTFSGMFSIPQGDALAEGQTDDKPVVLVGDTAPEFRNFLWALYALPHELMLVHSDASKLPRLIDIAKIANKYTFKSLETWALDAIVEIVTRRTTSASNMSISSAFSSPSTSQLSITSSKAQLMSNEQTVALVRLAQLCNHERLLTTMVDSLRKLMTGSIQNAYVAMTLADELDLRVLRGAAYLEIMQKASVIVARPSHKLAGLYPGEFDESSRLIVSQAQQLRLLSGFHRMSVAWEHLRAQPPNFDHAASCGLTWNQNNCMASWQNFWREKTKSDSVLLLGLADILGRLRAVLKEFDKWGSATYMHHDCRMNARRMIGEKIRSTGEELPDFFADDE